MSITQANVYIRQFSCVLSAGQRDRMWGLERRARREVSEAGSSRPMGQLSNAVHEPGYDYCAESRRLA